MIEVLVVDDQLLARLGHGLVLDAAEGIRVVGEAGSGEEAIEQVAALRPDVVLMDVRMPGMGGIAATAAITAQHPATRVVVFTSFDLDRFAFGALRAGASAFLLKSATPERLVEAVRTVHAGDAVVEPRITTRLVEHFVCEEDEEGLPPGPGGSPARSAPAGPSATPPALSCLSPREYDVFLAMASGMNNAEISRALFLTPATVKSHINHVFAKLQLRDRVQGVILAHRLGLGQEAPGD